MRIFKKTSLVSLIIMSIILCWTSQVQAAQEENYTYTITNSEAQITGYTGAGGTVEIPSVLGGVPVISICDFTFSPNGKGITSITIPDSVTSIGVAAFSNCTDLISISIPGGVTSIGNSAFSLCKSLTNISVNLNNLSYKSINGMLYNKAGTNLIKCPEGLTCVTIPEGVISIGDRAFEFCQSLTNISVPPGVTSIGRETFYCSGINTISIPQGVTNIGAGAFMGCSSLTSINIPESVTSIDDGAFSDCTNLTSFSIPQEVTSIGSGAFRGCWSLTTIGIPRGVASIGDQAFNDCVGLTNISFNSATTTIYGSIDTIPEATKIIGYEPSTAKDYATEYNRTFESITTLQSISVATAANKLSYIVGEPLDITGLVVTGTYNDGSINVESITDANITGFNSATAAVDQVLTITVGDKTTTYKVQIVAAPIAIDYTFTVTAGVAQITKYMGAGGDVIIPGMLGGAPVTSIGDLAFRNCTGLTSLTISEGITSIGHNVFYVCTGLTRIVVADDNINYSSKDGVLYNKAGTNLIACPGGLTSISIPVEVKSIGDSAFIWCTSLTSISIPEGVTSIGISAFEGCTGLTSINIPEGITSISQSTFDSCMGLTSINIPEGVTSIGHGAFMYCSGLTSISIPEGVTSIGGTAFANCAGLTSISIPKGVTSIGNQAFELCAGLNGIKVSIDNSNYASKDGVLYNKAGTILIACPGGLTSISIPEEVKSIGNSAFRWCTALTSISIPDGVTSIGDSAFDCCTGLSTIKFNSVTTTIYDSEYTIHTATKIIGYAPSTAKDYATRYGRMFEEIITHGDITAPVLQSATTDISGTKIILTFSKAMGNPGSSAEAFNVGVSRNNDSLTESITEIALGSDATQLILSLSQPLLAGDTVSISYIPGTLTSADGGILGRISNQAVTNQAPQPLTIGVNHTPITVSTSQTNLAITLDTIISAGDNPVSIDVPSGVTNTTLNVAGLLQTSSSDAVTSSALPALAISAAVDLNYNDTPVNVQVQIPQGTTITAPEGWDGTIHVQSVQASNSVTVTSNSGRTATVNSVIEVGYGDVPLTFSHAVRLLIPGQAGKKAGYVRSGTFYPISIMLNTDDQITANSTLAAGHDGYLNVGSDLVIWTKHFTRFVTYTERPINNSGRKSNSGGGGSNIPAPNLSPTVSSVQRLFGQNQVDTALAIAKTNYPGKVDNVILATAYNYPDALAGSVLAYKLNASILLVGNSDVDQEKVLNYLDSNIESTGTVYILGGTAVVSSAMEGKVTSSGFTNIIRLGGADKYDTSVKIADQLGVKVGTPIVLVSGEHYPDALSISSVAAQMQSPILLVQKDGISEEVRFQINKIQPTKIYIIGGTGVISSAVENQVAQMTSLDNANIVRLGGIDRYATSLAVAQYFNLTESVCIATGNNFPDALTGSVYAAKHNASIILADGSLSDQVINYIENRDMTGATMFGGNAAVSKEIELQLIQLIGK